MLKVLIQYVIEKKPNYSFGKYLFNDNKYFSVHCKKLQHANHGFVSVSLGTYGL